MLTDKQLSQLHKSRARIVNSVRALFNTLLLAHCRQTAFFDLIKNFFTTIAEFLHISK